MKLSEYFKREEFACPCGCGFDTVDAMLLDVLVAVRSHFAEPVIVTSGCRCPAYNAKVNGAKNSQHLYAKAADITVPNVRPEAIYTFACEWMGEYWGGVACYPGHVHIDMRDTPWRDPNRSY